MVNRIIYCIIIIFVFLYLLPGSRKKKTINTESFGNLSKKDNTKIQLDKSFLKNTHTKESFYNTKPYIWIYLEEEYNSKKWPTFGSRLTLNNMESYLIICLYSIYKHCGQSFNIIVLNDQNIFTYLPDLNIAMGPESTISLDRRRDLISFMLLYRYGGIWLNPNTIIMKDLLPTFNLLKEFDMIVFGCPSEYYTCNKGYLRPQRDLIMSLPGLKINYLCSVELNKMIQSYNFPAYDFNLTGDCIFWKYLKQMVFYEQFNFLHLSAEFDGTRDYNHKLIGLDNWLSTNRTYFIDEEKVIFVTLNRQELNENMHYKWFLRFSLHQIINSDLWIANLFRKSLGIKEKYYYTNDYRDSNITKESITAPPINIDELNRLFYLSNYFSTQPWDVVYNQ